MLPSNLFSSTLQFCPISSVRSSHDGYASGVFPVCDFRPNCTGISHWQQSPKGSVQLRQQWIPLAGIRAAGNSLWLAVESIESPGNLGTIIRTAEAAGVSGIFVLDSESDSYDPAAVRASMGSLFSQKLTRCPPGDFTHWAKSCGVAVVGSSPARLLDYQALRYRWPAALLIGSEKRGLFEHLAETADFTVRIPMSGGCESINDSVAAGVLLFEMSSQRQAPDPQ